MQDLHGSPHGSNDSAPNNTLRQFEVVKTEQVHALIEIKHSFRDVVQSEELSMAAVEIIDGKVVVL